MTVLQTVREARLPRQVGVALLVVLAAIGAVATWTFFTGSPGVGHFRTAAGREAYVTAYREAMALLPEPTAVHDIPTDHGTVRVYEWRAEGDRGQDPVLLMPGRSSGVPMWSENLSALARERRILAFDALGDAGLSLQSAPFMEFADQAHPIDRVITELAPEGVHLVGHSFGGAIAASYARQYPDRVLTLTLLEPVLTLASFPAGLWGWVVLASLPGLPEGLRETALGRIGGAEPDPAVFRDDPVARMISEATAHYAAALPTPRVLDDEALAQLTMPVYVAVAARDSLAGGQTAADRAAALPQATVRIWADTTHSLPMQTAGRLEPELLEFFSTHER